MRVVLFIKSCDAYIAACEGSGDNLLDEDIEQGYVDYIMTNVYRVDGYEFEEIDGAQIMLDKLVKDMEDEEFIDKVLEFHGYKNEDYIILENY